MKSYQLSGLIGIIVLLISGFLPLAYLNDGVITIFPFFNNFDLANSVWVWKDISAFSFTYAITLILSIYLLFKNYRPGYLIAASLNIVVILFIYFTIWLTSVNAADFNNVIFSYSISGFLLGVGYILYFYGGLKMGKKKKGQ